MDIYDLALAMTPRIGGRTSAYLINTLFSAEHIFSLSYEELRTHAKLSDVVATSIVRREGFAAAEREMEHCLKHGIKIIASTDLEYPPLLRDISDPPHVIYVEGDESILTQRLISMVGTRNMTNYGDRAATILVEQLAARVDGVAVVSGLAFGIDAAAHRAALGCGVPTIAVLPNSLPGVTPATHRALAKGIVDAGGALVTELPSTSRAAGKAYISRNRIIAGMSAATIVVESSVSGGALSTARMASGEGRVVGAVPGRIVDGAAMGCNRLIASREAVMVNSADDILAELKWGRVDDVESKEAVASVEAMQLDERYGEEQRAVLKQFRGSDPLTLVELQAATGLSITQLGVVLMELELGGAVRAIPGARYQSLL